MDPIRITRQGKFLLLAAPQEITADISTDCKDLVDDYFEDDTFKAVVMNLRNLLGITSCGIGLMVTLHTKCVSQGCAFYVMGANTHVLKTLELVQLRNFFKLVCSYDDIPGYNSVQGA